MKKTTLGFRFGGALLAAIFVLTPAALAQSRSHALAGEAAPPSAGAKSSAPGRLSKFEARRIRHACVGRANEGGFSGSERDAFLAQCYFGRVSHRGQRKECRLQGLAKGLEKTQLRDYIRECVKEKIEHPHPAERPH